MASRKRSKAWSARGNEVAAERLRLPRESGDEGIERLLEARKPIDEQLVGDIIDRDPELAARIRVVIAQVANSLRCAVDAGLDR